MAVRVRFAPSPTGHLHVGNVRTALYNWLFARQKDGAFVLRIEDTDLARSEVRFEEQLMEDLRWLGLTWDEGVDVGGPWGPYRQTDRFHLHQDYAEKLRAEGRAYYCFCSAEELENSRQAQLEAGRQPHYSGKCRGLPPDEGRRRIERGERAVLRLRVREGVVGFEDLVFGPIQIDCREVGDFVLLRSDGSAQYNFACVVDDTLMGITHVIRGEGHISNTHRQILIYEALGLDMPVFAHLSTILGTDGAKLSKRHGATSIDEFRRQGYLPEALDNYLALLGWASQTEGHEIFTLQELVREFDLARVNRSPAVFDPEKLNWINRSHLKRSDPTRLAMLALPYFQESGWIPDSPPPAVMEWLKDVVQMLVSHLDKLEDVGREAEAVFRFDPDRELAAAEVQEILCQPGAGSVITAFREQLERYEVVDSEAYRELVGVIKQQTGQKGKYLFHPIRVAVTGRASGPDLERLIPVLERGRSLALPFPLSGVRERVQAVWTRLA